MTWKATLFVVLGVVMVVATMIGANALFPPSFNGTVQVQPVVRDSRGEDVMYKYELIDGQGVRYTGNRTEAVTVPNDTYQLGIYPQNIHVKSIEMEGVDVSNGISFRVENVTRAGRLAKFVEVYAIDPTSLSFSSGKVRVIATGNVLFKCATWDFDLQSCPGDSWVRLKGIMPGEEYSITITPLDPGFGEMSVSGCNASNSQAANGTFVDACDNAYPGSALFYDDVVYENHTTTLPGQWAGIRINMSNTSITNCDTIDNVQLCYKWWGADAASIQSCSISIDANQGNSYTGINNTCPGTIETARPICINVTASETWTCENFFGTEPTGALIKSEFQENLAISTVNWDVLTLNVSYTAVNKINACGTVSATGYYKLNSSIRSAGSCLTVSANNSVIDCQGFSILYGEAAAANDEGIDWQPFTRNTTVKNCLIYNLNTTTNTNRAGIFMGNNALFNSILNNSFKINGSSAANIINMNTGANYTNISYNSMNNTAPTAGGVIYQSINGGNQVYNNRINVSCPTTSCRGIAHTASRNNTAVENTINGNGSTTSLIQVGTGSSDNILVYNLLTATTGSGGQGIDIVGANNTNISFNTINISNSISSKFGIYVRANSGNVFVDDNSITTNVSGSGGQAINIETSHNSYIRGNSVYTKSLSGQGILIATGRNNILLNNYIYTDSTSNSHGIVMQTGTNGTLVENNTVILVGGTATGILIQINSRNNSIIRNNVSTTTAGTATLYGTRLINNASFNYYYGNSITCSGSSAVCVYIQVNNSNNYFVNNNITSPSAKEIQDDGTDLNFFIYNNSFGEIKWISNGSNSFVFNLSLDVNNSLGFGLDKNIFIGNNTVAINTSAFFPLRINSSANITLMLLNRDNGINEIKKLDNFSVNQTINYLAGYNCTMCNVLSHANGILVFNVSKGLGSFSANFTDASSPSVNLAPLVFNILPVSGDSFSRGFIVNLAANVTDDVAVSQVFANITYPNSSSILFLLDNSSQVPRFNISFQGAVIGIYTVQFIANDTVNKINNTQTTSFSFNGTAMNLLIHDYGIEWVEVNWTLASGASTEVQFSSDNTSWGLLDYLNFTINRGSKQNLQEETTYYFRSRNDSLDDWEVVSQETKTSGDVAMNDLAVVLVLSLFGIVFIGLGFILWSRK